MTAPAPATRALPSFAELRRAATTDALVRACIQVRKNEIRARGWDIYTADGTLHADALARRAAAKLIFRRPDPDWPGFDAWLNVITEDLLVIDAVAVYPTLTLGGDLCGLRLLDPTVIEPGLAPHGGRTVGDCYRQYLRQVPRRSAAEILGLPTQNPERVYPYEDLAYGHFNVRSWTPFGCSPVEQCLGGTRAEVLEAFGLNPEALGIDAEGVSAAESEKWLRDRLRYLARFFTSLISHAGLEFRWAQS